MRVLVACEFSGVVREAFRKRGHDAWSCDLLPTELPGNHIQEDVHEVLDRNWDLMIAHPPCTYIAFSGIRWNAGNPQRQHEQDAALGFVLRLMIAPIEKIAIENPVGVITRHIRKWDQMIHPWQFGHGETKATCLWLKNLSPLEPTEIVKGRQSKVHRMSPNKHRSRERSRTFQGIADAMAEQWGARAL